MKIMDDIVNSNRNQGAVVIDLFGLSHSSLVLVGNSSLSILTSLDCQRNIAIVWKMNVSNSTSSNTQFHKRCNSNGVLAVVLVLLLVARTFTVLVMLMAPSKDRFMHLSASVSSPL